MKKKNMLLFGEMSVIDQYDNEIERQTIVDKDPKSILTKDSKKDGEDKENTSKGGKRRKKKGDSVERKAEKDKVQRRVCVGVEKGLSTPIRGDKYWLKFTCWLSAVCDEDEMDDVYNSVEDFVDSKLNRFMEKVREVRDSLNSDFS